MFDLIIIGGGPAAVAGGVYAARKKMKMLVIAESFGGQSLVSADVQNWIGTKSVSGYDLAKMLEGHLKTQEDTEILEGERVVSINKSGSFFKVATDGGKEFETKTILIATGSRRKRLGIPGEDKFDGTGVAYCSICDAPIFKGKDVAVVGGGNAGLEAVIDLIPYANKIYLLVRSGLLKGDAVTQEKIKANSKVEIIFNAPPKEIVGENMVTGLRYEDAVTKEKRELAVGGVFVEIGSLPNTDLVKDLVKLDERNEIIVDHKTQRSSLEGIWAAGDASDVLYKQNNISAGDAVKAVLNIYDYLNKK